MSGLAAVYGVVVGFSLGLTGGGGSIFAVPLLVYGLGLPPREAVAMSLAAVAATAAVGAAGRLAAGEVEVPTGLIFSAGGILGTPLGARIGGMILEGLLLLLFAGLMIVVAWRMWSGAVARGATLQGASIGGCRRDLDSRLELGPSCLAGLTLIGVATGILSGLFGVGGGFVIVPALVFFSGMPIHRAVATSLLAIAFVGASGVVAFVFEGRSLPVATTSLFLAGGVTGMWLGTQVRGRLSGHILQKGFALAILAVAAFILAQRMG